MSAAVDATIDLRSDAVTRPVRSSACAVHQVDATIDLRSDAVTQPTAEMWQAMRAAAPHWSADGADPSILALEARACTLTGKQAALFVPTGTMGNLVALMSQLERGDHLFLDELSHIHWSEEWSFATICGAVARPLVGRYGNACQEAVSNRDGHHQPSQPVKT